MVGTELLTDWPPERPIVHRIFKFSVETFLPWKHQFVSLLPRCQFSWNLWQTWCPYSLYSFAPSLKEGHWQMGERANSAMLYILSFENQAIMIEKTSFTKLWNIKQLTKLCDKHHSQSYEITYKFEISYKYKRWNSDLCQ